jgi:hypothetical protein
MLKVDLNVKKTPKTATIRNQAHLKSGRSHQSQDSVNHNSI